LTCRSKSQSYNEISNNEFSFISDNLPITVVSGRDERHVAEMAPSVQQQFDAVWPIPVVPEDDSNRMFVAGFHDCADEVLRYLIEVENMAENDPVIVSLREHLAEQEQEARWRLCGACRETDREHCPLETPLTKESFDHVPSKLIHGISDSHLLPRYRYVADTTDYDCCYSQSTDSIDTVIAEVIESVLLSNNLPATPELLQELIDGLCDDMTDSDTDTSGTESMDED